MENRKICFRCEVDQPLSEYYKHPQMGDGHLNKCKSCTKADTKERVERLMVDPEWCKSETDRHRNKYHRLGYREVHKPSPEKKKRDMAKYKSKYPEKAAATNASNHLKSKIKGNQLHHWSYHPDHYLDLIDVTIQEHTLIHRFCIYDQAEMKYRRKSDDVLLETREMHEEWMRHIFATEEVAYAKCEVA